MPDLPGVIAAADACEDPSSSSGRRSSRTCRICEDGEPDTEAVLGRRDVWFLPWVLVPALFLLQPDLIPFGGHNSDVFASETANVLLLTVMIWILVLFHEIAHIIALKARGGATASLQLSRRLHFVVAQTNMTSVRTIPRSQRYGPYLAGLSWDLFVLSLVLIARLAGVEWPVLDLVSLGLTTLILFQFAFFMRTDVYFALANWLRLDNLMAQSRTILRSLFTLHPVATVRTKLGHLSTRDLALSAVYTVLLVVGAGVVLGNFVLFIIPEFWGLFAEAFASMSEGPTSSRFWDGLVFVAIVVAGPTLWLITARKEHRDLANEQSVWETHTQPTAAPDAPSAGRRLEQPPAGRS